MNVIFYNGGGKKHGHIIMENICLCMWEHWVGNVLKNWINTSDCCFIFSYWYNETSEKKFWVAWVLLFVCVFVSFVASSCSPVFCLMSNGIA